MKKLATIAALALSLACAAQSNQATQRWTYMRLAELEARLRAELNAATSSTNYASAQEFTNAVQSISTLAVSQTAATFVDMYNANFTATAPAGVTTQYVCFAASDAAKAMPGLTNAVPVGARFIYSGPDGMGGENYALASGAATLNVAGWNMIGLSILPGTSGEKYFTQANDNPYLFELHSPTANSAVTFTIMKTVIAR